MSVKPNGIDNLSNCTTATRPRGRQDHLTETLSRRLHAAVDARSPRFTSLRRQLPQSLSIDIAAAAVFSGRWKINYLINSQHGSRRAL
jgi:hypothetical protein